MISMRIKNVNPKGWYDIPGYDGIYQINYWADIRKKLGNALGIWKYQGKRFANMKKREDDQHEFVRACDELKTELKKTRMYKMITRLLDWLAEKI